jgi:hypothetical protein
MSERFPARQAPEVFRPELYLEVGHTPDLREIIVNHPFIEQDARGGHLVFSPEQARRFARLLLRKADECKP